MTPEELMLEKKYFPYWDIEGCTYTIQNYDGGFYNFIDCELCGSTVNITTMLKHAQWHEKIIELIEWAQGVDKFLKVGKESIHLYKLETDPPKS